MALSSTSMFIFDRAVFFRDLEHRAGMALQQSATAGLNFLLARLEADAGFKRIREIAYMLATLRWETGHTFQPVKEQRADRRQNPRLWELQNRYWPSGFYGRGYVQITWQENYRRVGDRLAGTRFTLGTKTMTVQPVTFTSNPDLILTPPVAYTVVARGMREGWFTGRKLSQYIRDGVPPDYVNARRIINGLDEAERIAQYANGFELVLRASVRQGP